MKPELTSTWKNDIKPEPMQWGGIILASLIGFQAGGWFLLLGPFFLIFVLGHNYWEVNHE